MLKPIEPDCHIGQLDPNQESTASNMKQLATILAISAATCLSGCATKPFSPFPENYAGTSATLSDSFNIRGISEVEFFYAEQYEGNSWENARFKSLAVNHGRGIYMSPVTVSRGIPASKPTKLLIVARTQYAAPILDLTNAVYQVKGTIEFTPETGKQYVVTGQLGGPRAAVWVEEKDTHQVVGQKIEVDGEAAKLGFFDK
ncbi:MAG: hypothetical protein EPO09_07695 [Aquabacterium sp.]|uniref:hypothetical protein n=1 Tax=Aquabacterium sp. TaxID=1872578 RepID=UPI0012039E3E|nr:hypothetical protein [Aquabacterium sp.]TAK95626.1 MAG: hypothetical protein EPO09_07695 [Aquabacterium sp.]